VTACPEHRNPQFLLGDPHLTRRDVLLRLGAVRFLVNASEIFCPACPGPCRGTGECLPLQGQAQKRTTLKSGPSLGRKPCNAAIIRGVAPSYLLSRLRRNNGVD